MTKRAIWFIISVVAIVLIIAICFFGITRSRKEDDPQLEMRFQLSKAGYLRGLSARSRNSIQLDSGEKTTTGALGTLTTLFGEGYFKSKPIGYVFEATNGTVAKVWLSFSENTDEWVLNAGSSLSLDIKIILDVQGEGNEIKHNEWVLRKGTNRRALTVGRIQLVEQPSEGLK